MSLNLNIISGPPDPVSQCNVTNKTFNALYVACKAGYDGGLRQTFIIEVYQVEETFTTSSYLTPMTVVEIIF